MFGRVMRRMLLPSSMLPHFVTLSFAAEPSVKGTLTLKISNVSAYMRKIGQSVRSPRQQVAGLGWHIEVYPSVDGNTTYLECYLEGTNAFKWSASVDATFRLVKKNGGFGKERSFRKQLGSEPLAGDQGWDKFVTSEVPYFLHFIPGGDKI